MKKTNFPLVLTGNLTADGSVAYMRADGTWAAQLSEAEIIESAAVLADRVNEAGHQEVWICDPYPMPVRRSGQEIEPRSTRERIRRQGPTTRLRRPAPGQTVGSAH